MSASSTAGCRHTTDERLPGTLITIDGPGGVGKSTVAQLVTAALHNQGFPVHSTVEPTRTPLGEHIRGGTETYRGMALACLVAGDRHHHLATEILPALRAGQIVVGDRYLPSSLVLQRLDGIDPEIIWQLNTGFYVPDVAVLLNAEHPIIAKRLQARGAQSRFERQPGSSRAESDLYHQAAAQLRSAGWPVLALDCTTPRPETIATTITTTVLQTLAERSPM
jgi:dTMP kinase